MTQAATKPEMRAAIPVTTALPVSDVDDASRNEADERREGNRTADVGQQLVPVRRALVLRHHGQDPDEGSGRAGHNDQEKDNHGSGSVVRSIIST